jgi:TusA-related sulfurtransferase
MSSLKERNKLHKIDETHFSINVSGLACPYPQLLVISALSELPDGAELEITLDNPPSVRDIPLALKRRGHKVLDISRYDGSGWKITVQTA